MDFQADLTQNGIARAAILSLEAGHDTEAHFDFRLPTGRGDSILHFPGSGKTFSYLMRLAENRIQHGVDAVFDAQYLRSVIEQETDWAVLSEPELVRRIDIYGQTLEALVDLVRSTRTPFVEPPLHENENLSSARARIVTLASAPCAPPVSPSCLKPNEGLQTAA